MRAVVDTNVVVSRFLSPNGTPALILTLWEQGRFELVVSEPILAEYARVLAYPRIQARHQLASDEIAQVIDGFRSFAVLADPSERIAVIADDPADNMFLEAAVAGRCDFITSGDPHLLRVGTFRDVQILTPAAFLAVIQHEDPA